MPIKQLPFVYSMLGLGVRAAGVRDPSTSIATPAYRSQQQLDRGVTSNFVIFTLQGCCISKISNIVRFLSKNEINLIKT